VGVDSGSACAIIGCFQGQRGVLACAAMSIGVLNEGPLHAALKSAYAAHGGEMEVSVDSFVADAVRGGVMYEIQTGSFSGLGRKLATLADIGPVVLVHPIAQTTTIVKEAAGAKPKRRKSPLHGEPIHIVNELVYIPQLLNHPNFSVEVVMTEEESVRQFDKAKRRGRGGWRTVERRLLSLGDGQRLSAMEDLFEFLETDLPEPFTTRHLADALRQSLDIAQKMAYCLRHSGVTKIVGKQGNSLLYAPAC
jgi:hypothetical protein